MRVLRLTILLGVCLFAGCYDAAQTQKQMAKPCPTTHLAFTLMQDEFVTITVYNTNGDSVATVVNEIRKAGQNFVYFGDSKLPSGCYFYKIKVGSFTEIKKMWLVK